MILLFKVCLISFIEIRMIIIVMIKRNKIIIVIIYMQIIIIIYNDNISNDKSYGSNS